jgi:hypothetical protein
MTFRDWCLYSSFIRGPAFIYFHSRPRAKDHSGHIYSLTSSVTLPVAHIYLGDVNQKTLYELFCKEEITSGKNEHICQICSDK